MRTKYFSVLFSLSCFITSVTTNESQDFGPKGGILGGIGPGGGSVCEVLASR